MKDLTSFLITNITGSNKFSVDEEVDGDKILVNVKADPEIMGLIIGKEGKTIKNVRRILAIKATKEHKGVSVSVTEEAH